MAPQNPRPPRKKTARKPYTPRVAGSGQRPTDAVPETDSKAVDPVDSNPIPVDSTSDPVDGTTDPVDGTTDPADGTTDPADSATDPADGTTDPAEKPKPAGKTRPVARVSTLRTGDSASSTTRAATTDKNATTAAKSSTSSGLFPFGRRAIGILIGVAVVLGIFALIAGLHPGASISSNKAFVDQPATTELTSQVQSKACLLTVDTLDVDAWAGKARSVLTGSARTEFDKYLPQQRDILNQTKQVADCRVESVGVADLSGGGDGATARVVANLIVSQKQAGIAGQSAAPRYQFSMVKHGDDWLISQVEAF
ncbi:hypothetical protein [Gordonia hankookensis]|uniref:Mce-associated membrane protein n=1 Tax=Gordonia hankookensis TaxID=589403 RepID=A0ABR7W8U7_9ACTN|nr:hypothetical protein [Gordonia hankookensis]MBD1318946.1 hypothetical protein [Gordonia hankookensis]